MAVKKESISKPSPDRLLCNWKTGHRRCQMLGVIDPGTKKFYCHWHYVSLSRPEFAQNFFEFSEWRAGLRKRYTNVLDNLVLHYDDETVFKAIKGEMTNEQFELNHIIPFEDDMMIAFNQEAQTFALEHNLKTVDDHIQFCKNFKVKSIPDVSVQNIPDAAELDRLRSLRKQTNDK